MIKWKFFTMKTLRSLNIFFKKLNDLNSSLFLNVFYHEGIKGIKIFIKI